jgi:3-oxoacyl-[acyl-carrier-protein] synthase-3
MSYTSIIGTGSYIPENIIDNNYISQFVDTSDEWITERTGIKARRLSKGEDTSQLAIKAAQRAIEMAKINPEDIGLVILGTITPDTFTPSVACIVQSAIGAVNATSFDISAACSGFVYGLQIADKFLQGSNMKYALVIGSEVLSKALDWEDRNTCVIFADGAGAAILAKNEEYGIKASFSGSSGDVKGNLVLPALQVNNLIAKSENKNSVISMNGREIFKFAVQIIPKCINAVLEEANMSLEDIDYIVPHQANYRITESVAQKMNIPIEKFYMNLDEYGNTSSATIPLALDDMNRKGMLKKGQKIILVGFGGGLTWGSVLINWQG